MNNPQQPFAAQQQQQQPSVTPPASPAFLQKLPLVTVRPPDLIDPTNRECCICMEDITVASTVTRLPCAHFFHPLCGREWLRRSCNCPVCRYELPTDDAEFERGRRQRMRLRKPRYARHELDRLRVSELKRLAARHQRATIPAHILDKAALVDHLIASDCIDLIPTAPDSTVQYRISDLEQMSVRRLKHVMNEDAGVFFDATHDVVEKQDMIRVFVASGRLEVLPEEEEDDDDEQNQEEDVAADTAAGDTAATSHSISEEEEEDRKPAASVAVETVYSDTEENEEDMDNGISPRIHTDLVMEENVSFLRATATAQQAFAASERVDYAESSQRTADGEQVEPISRETGMGHAGAAATDPASISVSAAASDPSVLRPTSSPFAPASPSPTEGTTAPPPTPAPAASSTRSSSNSESVGESFQNLKLSEAHAVARELGVDCSDLFAERARLDRLLAERLTAAAAATNVPSSVSSEASSAENVSTVAADATSEEYQEDISPDRRRSSKRRRAATPYDSSSLNNISYSNSNHGTPEESAFYRFLQDRSVSELRAMAREKAVDLSGCIERSEMIDHLFAASWTAAPSDRSSNNGGSAVTAETAVFVVDTLTQNWSISDIRAIATVIGLSLSSSSNSSREAVLDELRAAAVARPYVARYLHALAPLATLTLPQLRKEACERHVSLDGCLEKGEILSRLLKATNITDC